MRWEYDGKIGWGEDQDGWRLDHFTKMMNALRAHALSGGCLGPRRHEPYTRRTRRAAADEWRGRANLTRRCGGRRGVRALPVSREPREPGALVDRRAVSSAKSEAALVAATSATNEAFKGTYRSVDGTPRPAVKGKKIVIMSAGQASISAQVPVAGAVEAAEAIGWQADVYDGSLRRPCIPYSCARRSRPAPTASCWSRSTARR